MATTVYLETTANSSGLTPVTTTHWDSQATTGFTRYDLNVTGTKLSTAHTDHSSTESGSLQEVCQAQWISPPLAAQTISGTIDIGIKMSSSVTGATFFGYVIRIINSSGTAVSTLLDHSANTGNGINSSSLTDEFDGAQAITSQSCSAGDRLVIEVGYDINNTSSKTMGMKAGTASATDVTSDSTSTTARNGNVVFSATLAFSSGTSNQLMMTGCGT